MTAVSPDVRTRVRRPASVRTSALWRTAYVSASACALASAFTLGMAVRGWMG